MRELLRPDTVLVAICAVDSELGTIQPVNEIAALLADHPNCRLHVDATQAIGRIPVDFSGIDTLSFGAAQVWRYLRERRAAQAQPYGRSSPR